jgi:hypothetical protein
MVFTGPLVRIDQRRRRFHGQWHILTLVSWALTIESGLVLPLKLKGLFVPDMLGEACCVSATFVIEWGDVKPVSVGRFNYRMRLPHSSIDGDPTSDGLAAWIFRHEPVDVLVALMWLRRTTVAKANSSKRHALGDLQRAADYTPILQSVHSS